MQKIIVATNNANKLKEIKDILGGQFELISLRDAGLNIDPEENGSTFDENALIKAKAVFEASGLPSLADDSGLCVDALNGAPGVLSARYGGEHGSDTKNNEKLLCELKMVKNEKRTARFVSAIVLYDGKKTTTAIGETEGRILFEAVGKNGFGYDPLFYSFDLDKSFGEATANEKNSISHRKRALSNLLKLI